MTDDTRSEELAARSGAWARMNARVEAMPTGTERSQALVDMNVMLTAYNDALRAGLRLCPDCKLTAARIGNIHIDAQIALAASPAHQEKILDRLDHPGNRANGEWLGPSEREKAAIWDHVEGDARDYQIGPREQAVIDAADKGSREDSDG